MKPTNRDIIASLNEIIEDGVIRYPIPVKKGNSIRIKNAIVRKNKHGYHIFDAANREFHDYSYSLATALAIAKSLATNKYKEVDTIKYLDQKLSKYYNDALFYKYTIENTKDEIRRDSAEMRYDIALEECRRIKEQIETYIFDK
jgi:AAA+ ATPase superfamily predicted ATPase